MKIIALVENTVCDEALRAEHGLSLYIEALGYKILFDMGQTELFAENAEKLGVDLAEVDIAILSHGHYDHGGGLRKFLEINDKAPVYISRNAFGEYYNGTEKYIGLDISLCENERLIFVDDEITLSDGLKLYSCSADKQYKKMYDLGSFGLYKKEWNMFVPDDFLHEQYLLIEENGKRVLLSGCSHKGILNIAEWFKPDILVGGFHFSKLPLDDVLATYARVLNAYDTVYYTCHCTGAAQFEFMKKYMSHLQYLAAGQMLEV